RPGVAATSTSSRGSRAASRVDHRAPSALGESRANDTGPSPRTGVGPRSTSYHAFPATDPNAASCGPSMAGLVFQVKDSSHDVEDIENTLPPTGDASSWYRSTRTSTMVRPASPLTENRANDCRSGLAS